MRKYVQRSKLIVRKSIDYQGQWSVHKLMDGLDQLLRS